MREGLLDCKSPFEEYAGVVDWWCFSHTAFAGDPREESFHVDEFVTGRRDDLPGRHLDVLS